MPRLLTRMSTSGNCATSAAQPSAPPRSNAAAWTLADGEACRIFAIASVTAASSRPLTITSAPICASPIAVASPMPRVEPVTSADFPVRSRFIRPFPKLQSAGQRLFGWRHDDDVPGRGRSRSAQKKPAGGDYHALAVGGMLLHPRLAILQLPVGGLADTDEAGSFD